MVICVFVDGWVINFNVYIGEFIICGFMVVVLVKENMFYVMVYLEEIKLEGVCSGYCVEIILLGSSKIIKGMVDSIVVGVINVSSSSDLKGMVLVDFNFEWVCLVQCVLVCICFDYQQGNLWLLGIMVMVVIIG